MEPELAVLDDWEEEEEEDDDELGWWRGEDM